MIYLWLKALHVAAVLIWTGGLLTAALVTARASKSALDASLIEGLHRFDTRVTSPAMFIVWGAGLALAMLGQWFPSPWLIAKLAIVVALSALHGVLAAKLRQLSQGETLPQKWLQHVPAVIVSSLLAIAILVVVKPF
jgi:uncharacterized membrane protein